MVARAGGVLTAQVSAQNRGANLGHQAHTYFPGSSAKGPKEIIVGANSGRKLAEHAPVENKNFVSVRKL